MRGRGRGSGSEGEGEGVREREDDGMTLGSGMEGGVRGSNLTGFERGSRSGSE